MIFTQITKRAQSVNDRNGKPMYILPKDLFLSLIREALSNVDLDEKWYQARYPDVREAVEKGSIPSYRAHFIEKGYFENRLPRRVVVDEKFYLESYADVRASVAAGRCLSAQAHYERFGHREGRLPRAGFSLFTLSKEDNVVSINVNSSAGATALKSMQALSL